MDRQPLLGRSSCTACKRRAAVADDCCDGATVPLAKGRRPKVDDQDDAELVAVVPRLVLDRIVENEGLADIPLGRRLTDPEAAAARHYERQVADEPRIGDACM